MKMAS